MNGLFGLHHGGMLHVHVVSFRWNEVASGLSSVAMIHTKILNAQTPDGSNHPAVLVAMIVNAANLSDIPADSHHFKKITFVNQVSRVVALCVKKIGRERLGLNAFLGREFKNSRNLKFGFRYSAELLYSLID